GSVARIGTMPQQWPDSFGISQPKKGDCGVGLALCEAVEVGVGSTRRQCLLDDGNQQTRSVVTVSRELRKQNLKRFRADINEQISQSLRLVAGIVRQNADRDRVLLKLSEAALRVGIARLLRGAAQCDLRQWIEQAEACGPQQVRPCPDPQRV